MNEDELALTFVFFAAIAVFSCLGGAIGMRLAGGGFWKGALLAAILNVGMIVCGMIIDNTIFAIVGGVIVMGLASRVMKVPAAQSANVIIGCLLFSIAPTVVLGFFM